jgi:hypothetical protein
MILESTQQTGFLWPGIAPRPAINRCSLSGQRDTDNGWDRIAFTAGVYSPLTRYVYKFGKIVTSPDRSTSG